MAVTMAVARVALLVIMAGAAAAPKPGAEETGSPSASAGRGSDPSWYYRCPQAEASDDGAAEDGDAEKTSYGTRRRKATTPFPVSCPTSTTHPWCNPEDNSTVRAAKLVKELTLDELAAFVSNDIFGGVPKVDRLGVNSYNFIRENGHGMIWSDVCPVPTIFPQVILMAAAFNRSLWRAAGEASGRELRYNYEAGKQNSLFAQANFNVFLDPRWGRGQEVPGESPDLNSEYAKAWVAGVQAPKGPNGVPLAGCGCKHFVAYSVEGDGGWPDPVSNSNRHNFNAEITLQDLADTHFPMFVACAKVGAKGIMTSYNAVNGVPMAANGNLTNGLLREKWGFEGTVVTDCGAVEDLSRRHKYVKTANEALRVALEGGTDIECGNVAKAAVTPDLEPLLRRAVEHSFKVRIEVGEFDPPPSNQQGSREGLSDEARAAHARLAFDAAVQGSVLLKNEGGTLPLKAGARIALLGPLRTGNWEMNGNYAGYMDSMKWSNSPNLISPLEGLRACEDVGELIVPEGPRVCALTDEVIAGTGAVVQKPDADVIVLVAGTYGEDNAVQDVDARPAESGKCQAGCLQAEGCDRPSLELPLGQQQLIKRAASWGLPLVLVLISGGAVDVSELAAKHGVDAILWMGYPGQAAGTALASLLFGRESPSGRLTQTFYNSAYLTKLSIADMNVRPNKRSGYPGRSYRFVDDRWVVYPFGYGLSYQTWLYEWSAPLPCGVRPAGGCTDDPTERCFYDDTCGDDPSSQGCNAGGAALCRSCGFGAFPACPTSEAAAARGVGGGDGDDGLFEECTLTVEATMVSSDANSSSPGATLLLFLRPPLEAGPMAPKKELRHFKRVRASPMKVAFNLRREDFMLADAAGNFALQEGRWLAELGAEAELRQELTVSASGCSLPQCHQRELFHRVFTASGL